jgi:hypothetical protein
MKNCRYQNAIKRPGKDKQHNNKKGKKTKYYTENYRLSSVNPIKNWSELKRSSKG